MSADQKADAELARLPREFVDRLTKPFGQFLRILAFSRLVVRLGMAIRGVGFKVEVTGGGAFLAGIGFTMALFIAHLTFSKDLIDAAKLGILLGSVVSAVAGVALLAWLSPTPAKCLPVRDRLVD